MILSLKEFYRLRIMFCHHFHWFQHIYYYLVSKVKSLAIVMFILLYFYGFVSFILIFMLQFIFLFLHFLMFCTWQQELRQTVLSFILIQSGVRVNLRFCCCYGYSSNVSLLISPLACCVWHGSQPEVLPSMPVLSFAFRPYFVVGVIENICLLHLSYDYFIVIFPKVCYPTLEAGIF